MSVATSGWRRPVRHARVEPPRAAGDAPSPGAGYGSPADPGTAG
ncbi:hypothetical protein [Streptomyces misionensis]|nr:hypothetical protein [Streptomyces misionensis]